jgi:hypothetical protein
MLTASQSLTLYQLFLKYFKNEEDARLFVTEIENTMESTFASGKEHLVAKEELASTKDSFKDEMQQIRQDIKEQISLVRLEIKDVRVEIHDTKVNLIKWVFGFFVALSLMIIGLYLKK